MTLRESYVVYRVSKLIWLGILCSLTQPLGHVVYRNRFWKFPKCLIEKIRALSPKKLKDLAGVVWLHKCRAKARTIWSAQFVVHHRTTWPMFFFSSSWKLPSLDTHELGKISYILLTAAKQTLRYLCQTVPTKDPQLSTSGPSLHPHSGNNYSFNYNTDALPEKLQRNSMVINSWLTSPAKHLQAPLIRQDAEQ